ncbi:MAG: molybdenum cofactor guanylyltransferase [Luteolibacter sp.]
MFGLVLAGGKGVRMGMEKAGMEHPDGRTFVRRAVELLREAGCGKVVIALREGQEIPTEMEEVELVRDAGEGPLGGMIAGMEVSPDEDWLVVACDLPRLEVSVLEGLLGFPDRFVIYGGEKGLEPLCGVYGKGALEVLKKSRDEGIWGLQRILRENDAKVIRLKDEGLLLNANKPEDLSGL